MGKQVERRGNKTKGRPEKDAGGCLFFVRQKGGR